MLGFTERDFDISLEEINEQNDDLIARYLKDMLGHRKELLAEKYRRITGRLLPESELQDGARILDKGNRRAGAASGPEAEQPGYSPYQAPYTPQG